LLVNELFRVVYNSGRTALAARVHIEACPVDTAQLLVVIDAQVVEELRIYLELENTLGMAVAAALILSAAFHCLSPKKAHRHDHI